MMLKDLVNKWALITLLTLILTGCSGGGGGGNLTVSGSGSSSNASGQQKVVFAGASSIAYGNWSAYFGIPIENNGVPGIESTTLANTIANYVASHPDKIFIMIGLNDVRKRLEGQVVGNISTIIDKINAVSPGTKIFIHSILPMNHASYNEVTERVNPQIQALCERRGVTYLFIHNHFKAPNRVVDLSLYRTDGIHLNENGYSVWVNAIRRHVLS